MWNFTEKTIISELGKLIATIEDASNKQRNEQFITVEPLIVRSCVEDITTGPVLINTKNIKYIWCGDEAYPDCPADSGCTIEMDTGEKFRLKCDLSEIYNLLIGI